MESCVQRWRPRTNAFCDFSVHLSKLLRLPRKSDARSYEVLHLSRKIISANLKIWCSKMQHLSGNQLPDLLTSLMNMSLVLRLPCDMHLSRSSSNVTRLPSILKLLQNPQVSLTFDNGVQLFISHLTTWLHARRFSKPTFRPSGATNHWKTQGFATFLPFRAPASSFFSLFLFSDLLSSAFLLSGSSHLCFSICPYCGKFDF